MVQMANLMCILAQFFEKGHLLETESSCRLGITSVQAGAQNGLNRKLPMAAGRVEWVILLPPPSCGLAFLEAPQWRLNSYPQPG